MTDTLSAKLFLPALNCEETLTSTQLQTSQLLQSLCTEATSLTSILTLMTGQTVASLARSGSFRLLSYCFGNAGKKIATYHYTSSIIACAAEGIAFNTATEVGRTGHFQIGTCEENLHGFLTLGVCKILAGKSGNSLILQHGIQDSAMVTVDVVCEGLGFIEKREEGFVQRMSGAELASFRMGISAKLTHMVCIDVSHFNAKQDLDYAFRKSGTRKINTTKRSWMRENGWDFELATCKGAAVENIDPFSLNLENSPWKQKGSRVFAMSAFDHESKIGRAPLKSLTASSPLKPSPILDLLQSTNKRLLIAKMFQDFLNRANPGEDTATYFKTHAKRYLANHPDFQKFPEEQRGEVVHVILRDSLILFPERLSLLEEHQLDIPLIRASVFVASDRKVERSKNSYKEIVKNAELKLITLTHFYGFEISTTLYRKVLEEIPILAEYFSKEKINEDDGPASARAVRSALPDQKPWLSEWVSLFYLYRGESEHHIAMTFGTARLLRGISQTEMFDKGFSRYDRYKFESGTSKCDRKYWRELLNRYAPANLYSDKTRKRLARSYIMTHFPELPIWQLPYYQEGTFFEDYEKRKVARYFKNRTKSGNFKLLGIRFFFARNEMDLSVAELTTQKQLHRATYEDFEDNETYPSYRDLLRRSEALGVDFTESLSLLIQTHFPDLIDPETGHPRLKREPIYIEARIGEERKVRRYIENIGSAGEDLFWDRKKATLTFDGVVKKSEGQMTAERLAQLEENLFPPTKAELALLRKLYGTAEEETILTRPDWKSHNQIAEIEKAIAQGTEGEAFHELLQRKMQNAGLLKADLCREGEFDKYSLSELEKGQRKPTLDTVYHLIGLIQKKSVTQEKIDPVDFYEAHQTDLQHLPFYDRLTKTYRVRIKTVAALKEVLQTPLATYLYNQMEANRLKPFELAAKSGIKSNRLTLILRGQAYLLELPEIIALARALDIGLDEMYLRVHKEMGDFATIVSEMTKKVLRARSVDFREKATPDSYKPPPSSFAQTLLALQTGWNITVKAEMAKRLRIPATTLTSYLAGITPPLPVFYELCRQVDSLIPERERIAHRAKFYWGYAPEAQAIKILDPKGRKIVLTVPEDEIADWSYERFQQTSFSWLISQIEQEADAAGYTTIAFAAELGEVRGMIQVYKNGKILEVRWNFIEKLAKFIEEHLAGKYHPSFIAAIARPEIFDLAKSIVNQRGELIYEPDEKEPLDFKSRYRERLKSI